MIDRNEVAREKMSRAAEMLAQRGIDAWVVYTRGAADNALELMFNTSTKNEVLFLLTKDGKRVALVLSLIHI